MLSRPSRRAVPGATISSARTIRESCRDSSSSLSSSPDRGGIKADFTSYSYDRPPDRPRTVRRSDYGAEREHPSRPTAYGRSRGERLGPLLASERGSERRPQRRVRLRLDDWSQTEFLGLGKPPIP